MRIYKFEDDKYHYNDKHNGFTTCGKSMSESIEDRIVGTKDKHYPDPDKKDLCKVCFSFMNIGD